MAANNFSEELFLQGMLVLLMTAAALAGSQAVRGHKAALLIIDVQDCFLPGGNLAVTDGDQVIPVINRMRKEQGGQFSLVVLSQDWHCPDHVSFASQHPGAKPYQVLNLTYNQEGSLCHGANVAPNSSYAVDCSKDATRPRSLPQTMWPEHCIKNVSSGPKSASFSSKLTREGTDIVVQKGHTCWVDSYSAFFDNGQFRQTELNSILKTNKISLVVVTGLALDYCVYYTSKDAVQLGYKVLTVVDASRGVAPDTTAAAKKDMAASGVELIQSGDLEGRLQEISHAQSSTSSMLLLLGLCTLLAAYLLLKR